MVEIIAAFIAGGFTVILASGKNRSRYITQERENWRRYIRDWLKDITQIIYDDWDYNRLQSFKGAIILRLNPTRDTDLINNVNKLNLMKNYPNRDGVAQLEKVKVQLQKLLKHDWERVKKNKSILGSTPMLNLTLLTYLLYFMWLTIDKFSLESLELDVNMIMILSTFLVIKFAIAELNKIPLLREFSTFNIFECYSLSINMISFTEIFTLVIYSTILILIFGSYNIINVPLLILSSIILIIWIFEKITCVRNN
ncbi:MAG: hypothetical protein KQ78_01326 [Candidatus Izimaplasma bacterium HR2]|nr:MAG: hypothetical protein KQ78_01326 [Candidatus Izimaplasma bacterium HR2]